MASPRPLAAAAALLLLAAPVALATISQQYAREVLGPSGERTAGSWRSTATCDPGPTPSPYMHCFDHGVGGAVIDVSNLNENGAGATDPAGGLVWASGQCAARQTGAPAWTAVGDFAFLCGVDRDDDGLVTDHDVAATDPDGFDDDFAGTVVPSGSQGSMDVCFRADGGSLTASGTLGASWDVAFVFVARNAASTSHAEGTFLVELALTTRGDGCPGNASGHTHDGWRSAGLQGAPSCGTAVLGPCHEQLWIG
jgi:hypothetical protein